MKKILLGILIGLGMTAGVAYAATSVFKSNQIGSSPSNGRVAQTDGTNTTWVATSTLGFSGAPCSVTANSVQYNNGGAFGCVTNLTWSGTALTNTATTTLASTSIPSLYNLTSNGFIKTSGSNGLLSIDTNSYLTGNQTITLTGDVTGSGSTAITTTYNNVVGVTKGGSGTTTAPTQLGQILAADATGVKYGPTTFVNGSNITITTSTPGQITIASSAGGGTPCTTTGFSFQYNNVGSFGCVSKLITDGSLIGYNATSSTVGFNIQGTGNTNTIFNVASSTGTSFFNVLPSGLVGISTTSPIAQLHVAYDSTSTNSTVMGLHIGTLAATSTSANGTYFSINTPSSFTGNLIDVQSGSASKFKLTNAGNAFVLGSMTVGSSTSPGGTLGVEMGTTNGSGLLIHTSASQGNSQNSLGLIVGTNEWDLQNANGNGVGELRFIQGGSGKGNISSGGNWTAGPTGAGSVGSSVLNSTGNLSIGASYYTTAAPSNGAIIQGNVAIGSTTALTTLAVKGSNGATDPFDVASSTGTSLLRVKSSGNVGIGTTTPGYLLVVAGTVQLPNLTTSGSAQTANVCLNAANEVISDTVGCLVSAARFKQDINSLDSGLKEVLALRPVSFYYKPEFNGALQSNPNYNGQQVGFIADEVQKIDPRLVTTVTNTSTNGSITSLPGQVESVRYENITAVLVKAIQEQQNLINGLKVKAIKATRSVEENWQWFAMGLLALGFIYQQLEINKLKNK